MLRFRRISQLLVGVACTALISTNTYASLLTNGSFEAGTFVDDGNKTMTFTAGPTSITDWTAVGSHVSWIDTGNPWGLSAQDGDRFLDLTGYTAGAPFGGVTQTVATTIGQQYDLSFYLGSYTQRWGGPPVSILAMVDGVSQTFTVTTTSSVSTWTPFLLHFTASSASTTVTLMGAAGSNYIGLDNLSLDPAGGGGAVPEPESYVLTAIGIAILVTAGLIRRCA
jgi:hypothetical protein